MKSVLKHIDMQWSVYFNKTFNKGSFVLMLSDEEIYVTEAAPLYRLVTLSNAM